MTKNTNNDITEQEYVSVSSLMKKYNLSRPTVIRWVKSNPDVRFFQEGQRFMRINFNDFKEMIAEKVNHSIEQLHGSTVEKDV